MKLLSRLSLLTIPALTLLMGPQNLSADAIYSYYQFTGTCADCSGSSDATLTLVNYTPGSALDASNFVSFSYTSNLFSLSIPSASQLSFITGEIPGGLPAQAFVDIFDTNTPTDIFVSYTNGNWSVGPGADSGTGATWDAAPEPASLVLVLPAAAAFVLIRRRRARRA